MVRYAIWVVKCPSTFIRLINQVFKPHWSHYLVATEFILHSNHEALKYIQGQHKLNSRHAKLVEYLQSFHFTIILESLIKV